MSSQPPTGQSASPGERTAAWKMAQPQAKRQVQKRPKRPRIDIDEQIEEANRLAALLKKVQQSAKNIKKSGQRTKKRLLAKGRLSGDDLERISVIKRCGLIVDPRVASSGSGESEVRPSIQISQRHNPRNDHGSARSHFRRHRLHNRRCRSRRAASNRRTETRTGTVCGRSPGSAKFLAPSILGQAWLCFDWRGQEHG